MLLRVRDRLTGGFADAPPDNELTLAQMAAWETYCVGRLERLGVPVNQQRWRYNFRNRHGFTDQVDAAFDRLWTSDGLTWGELQAITRRSRDDRDVRPSRRSLPRCTPKCRRVVWTSTTRRHAMEHEQRLAELEAQVGELTRN